MSAVTHFGFFFPSLFSLPPHSNFCSQVSYHFLTLFHNLLTSVVQVVAGGGGLGGDLLVVRPLRHYLRSSACLSPVVSPAALS
jgi:hypothetical protein